MKAMQQGTRASGGPKVRKWARTSLCAMFLGVLAGVSAPREASASFSYDWAFVGHTSSLTPPVQLLGGGGSFTFLSDVCAGVSNDTAEGGLCSISLSGTYSNLVCGTGTATGSG